MRENFTTYRTRRAVNWSTLSAMRESPARYHYRIHNEAEPTQAMLLGRLIHTAVLEPQRLEVEYAVWDGGRRNTNDYKDWLDEIGDAEPTTRADMEKALAISAAVHSHRVAQRLLRAGMVERTLTWIDPVTRIRCKGRPDHMHRGALTDLKSTRDIDARAFGNSCHKFGYHAQMAFYRRGMDAKGMDYGPTRLIAVEAEPPHEIAVYVLGEDVLAAGDALVSRLLHEVKHWRRRGQWPGRYPNETPLEFPSWGLPELDFGEIEVLES